MSAALLLTASIASAETFTGKVVWVETWRNGNVAFRLDSAVSACNQQFILNASAPGAKTQYASVLAAKLSGKSVQVTTSGCGPADNYNPNVLYNIPEYVLVTD